MRRFLYSKWFFGFLALVCFLDLLADVTAHLQGWTAWNFLIILIIGLDVVAVILTLWMFVDLHRRYSKHGSGPDSGR